MPTPFFYLTDEEILNVESLDEVFLLSFNKLKYGDFPKDKTKFMYEIPESDYKFRKNARQ